MRGQNPVLPSFNQNNPIQRTSYGREEYQTQNWNQQNFNNQNIPMQGMNPREAIERNINSDMMVRSTTDPNTQNFGINKQQRTGPRMGAQPAPDPRMIVQPALGPRMDNNPGYTPVTETRPISPSRREENKTHYKMDRDTYTRRDSRDYDRRQNRSEYERQDSRSNSYEAKNRDMERGKYTIKHLYNYIK